MLWIILLILGGIFGVLFYMIFKKKEKQSVPPVALDLTNLRINDARIGDTISIVGAGDDYDDLDCTVDRRNRYESGRDEWYEVSGMYRGRRVDVECFEGDELEVSAILKPVELSLEDIGVSEDDLARMDEEQSRANKIEWDGEWFYEVSREIRYFQDDSGEGEGFYSWDFRSEDGKRVLFVQKWEGEPFEVGISQVINPDDIRVYRA